MRDYSRSLDSFVLLLLNLPSSSKPFLPDSITLRTGEEATAACDSITYKRHNLVVVAYPKSGLFVVT